MRRALVVLFLLSFVLASAGAFALWLFHRPARDNIVELVPPDATGYVHLFLRPSTHQRLEIEALLENVLGSEDATDSIRDALAQLLDPLLEGAGLDFETDVRPHLGKEAAWFELADVADQAVLVTAKDGEAEALNAVAEELVGSRRDIGSRVIGDVVGIGTEAALDAAALAFRSGRSLADQDAYTDEIGSLPAQRVLDVYLKGEGDSDLQATVSIREDGIQLDLDSPDDIGSAVAQPLALLGSTYVAIPTLIGEDFLAPLRFAGALRTGGISDHDDTLGDGFRADTLVDVDQILGLARTFGLLDSDAGAWLEHISLIVTGDDGSPRTRIFIGVQ